VATAAREANGGGRSHKFCFVGRSPYNGRMAGRVWIEEFARRHFDNTSVFVYTDVDRASGWVGSGHPATGAGVTRELHPEHGRVHTPIGTFDRTLDWKGEGFVPTSHRDIAASHLDATYFALMANCRYALTPAGDSPWSLRFYEALALGVIPVVR
jgi:hypothetical protein